MLSYPQTYSLGSGGDEDRHVRRPGELLLAFDEGTADTAVDEVLRDHGLAEHAPPADGGMRSRLRTFTMRWVDVDPPRRSRDVARALHASVPELWLASPVYDPVSDPSGANASAPIPDIAMVRFVGGAIPDTAPLDDLGIRIDVESSGLFPSLERCRLSAGIPDDGFECLARFGAMDTVERAGLDWVRLDPLASARPPAPPRTPHWRRQWNLHETGFSEAWRREPGSPAVRIAVIDTGFDLAHPAMEGAFTPRPTHRYFGPRNAVGDDVGIALDAAYDPDDFRWHGTAVAGMIASRRGTAGAAGRCVVLPVRVNPVSGSNVAAALRWAALHGARVANLSLSVTTQTNDVELAVAEVSRHGMLVCAAAGNFGPGNAPVKSPARLPGVLAVGACVEGAGRKTLDDPADEQWQSASGVELDVLAPGIRIPTTDARGRAGFNRGGRRRRVSWFSRDYTATGAGDVAGDFLYCFTGTSSAVPHVSSLAGLILSRNGALTADEVREIIESTCDRVGGYHYADGDYHPNGPWSQEGGYGRINAARALARVP